MALTDSAVLDIFKETGALLEGHFLLRSGLHSEHFFQCARVCEHLDAVEKLIASLLETIKSEFGEFDTVVAPAMGGLVLGQEAARQSKKRFIFLEKVDGELALRRNFKIAPQERVLVIEDVVTRGGRVQETIDILEAHKAQIVGIGILVDRSAGNAKFNYPFASLLEMSFPTYDPEKLPEHLQGKYRSKTQEAEPPPDLCTQESLALFSRRENCHSRSTHPLYSFDATHLEDLKIGASVAVDGTCLSVVTMKTMW